MPRNVNGYAHLVGRILMSLIFVISGLSKLFQLPGTAAAMATKGIPLVSVALPLVIVFELGSGLLLLVGYRTRVVALLLGLYLVPVTLLFHNFWAFHGMDQQMQMANFLKNLAILGGLLELASDGAGGISFDQSRSTTSR